MGDKKGVELNVKYNNHINISAAIISLYRAATIMHMMDKNLRRKPSLEKFKTCAKNGVKQNILIKPIPSQVFRDII